MARHQKKGGVGMISVYPWIYVDDNNNVWKFWISDSRELYYNIMYGDDKWTKKNLIDIDVLSFSVCIDNDGYIHIVYSTLRGELKYCTMRNKQWVGKSLYSLESHDVEINHISIVIIKEEMHVIFMIISNDGSDHGVVMHCKWNGKSASINTVQDIILASNCGKYYTLQRNNNSLTLFFINDEGDEVALKCCSFKNTRWTDVKRLYGIQGDNIYFDVLSDEQEIHVLNKSKEDSTYLLDHVSIDISGNIKDFRVLESHVEPLEALLINESNNLYSCWLEQSSIFYSSFDGVKWSSSMKVDNVNVESLQRYYCYMIYDEDKSFKFKSIYGTIDPELNLFIPNELIKELNDPLYSQINNNGESSLNEISEIQSIRTELSHMKVENKSLEKKIASLNMQLQKKQRLLEDYEDTIAKILENKRKIEENCNIYLEVQQNNQKELERLKKELVDSNEENTRIKFNLEESKGENEELLKLTKKVIEENNVLNIKLKEIEDSVDEVNVELKNLQENNELIQKEVERITREKEAIEKQLILERQENIRLMEELEFEKNQSIMDRLLRRRSSDI